MMTNHDLKARAVREPLFRSLEEFLSDKGPRPQHFSIDPARENIITGSRGTRFTIFPFSIVDDRSSLVRGEVDIELVELFQPAEMILANRPSTSEDRLLESGGQVAVFASQNGRALHLCQAIKVELPIWGHPQNPLAMRLFERSAPTMRTIGATPSFDWRLVSGAKVGLQRINGVKYNVFHVPSFNWYHCTYFLMPRKQKVMVSVYPVGIRKLEDQLAFLSFRQMNAVARMHWSGSHFTAFNIPAKSSAEVIILGLKHGQLFLGRNRFRKAKDKTLHIHLHHCTQMDVIDALQDM